MREDMYKVIVERPRLGGGRHERLPPRDPEDSPRQEGLKRRHRNRKWLNDHLSPLERYLAAQVGRPWDKVYSEVCAVIDRRNTVQQHIHEHLDDFVARRVVEVDGVLCWDRRWGGLRPIAESHGPRFYVDPRTGLLRLNERRIRMRRQDRERRRQAAALRNGGAREGLRVIDAQWQLHRIDGVWYRVEVARIDTTAVDDMPIDALRRLPVDQCPRDVPRKGLPDNAWLFGDARLYAVRKRQLGARELRHFRLHNDEP